MNNRPLLSVVIPTYNEEEDIEECLKTLYNQDYKKIEVIIVDDGSKDKTLRIVHRFKKVKLIKQNHKGPGAARNLGAKFAKGEILIFVDSDMSFPKNFLAKLTKPIIEGKAIGTTRETEIVKNTENIWSRCWGRVRVRRKESERAGAFRAIRTDKFFELGGFDSRYGYADDQTIFFKYGIRPTVAGGARCYHKNPETLKGVYNQSKWIGASIDNNLLLKIPMINLFALFIMVLFFPLSIIYLSLRKCYKNKDWEIFVPWMFIFITARYFGTIHGIINKIYFNKNAR